MGLGTTAAVGAGTVATTASALGVTAVVHSSGAAILTGSAGYVAGTIGTAATAVVWAPVVLGAGAVVGLGAGWTMYHCRDKLKD